MPVQFGQAVVAVVAAKVMRNGEMPRGDMQSVMLCLA